MGQPPPHVAEALQPGPGPHAQYTPTVERTSEQPSPVGQVPLQAGTVSPQGGHVAQSCGHVEQSSEGPHSPSPHTQLHGGDPPVQLQRPALQPDVSCLKHAVLAIPLRPPAATSSLQAFRLHGGKAVATEGMMTAARGSSASPMSALRAATVDL